MTTYILDNLMAIMFFRRTQRGRLDIGRVIDAITFTQVGFENIRFLMAHIFFSLLNIFPQNVYNSCQQLSELMLNMISQTSVLNYTYFLNNIISLFGAAG